MRERRCDVKIKTEVHGVDDVQRLLMQIAPKHARNIMRSTIHGVAGEIRDEARARAPTDGPPKTFAPAIKTKRGRGTPTTVRSDVIVERRAFFWKFLEYGTSSMSAKPTFGPVVEAMRHKFEATYVRQFKAKFAASLARAQKRQQK